LPNGTLFQDMSGSAVTQALALAALQHSGAGATATGSQAAANLAAATQKEIEMAKLATSLVTGGLSRSRGSMC
jgi:predicted outer membrane protein